MYRLTTVETMFGLAVRAAFTVWKMSISPSTLTLSISDMTVMKTPVLDIPSLCRVHRADTAMTELSVGEYSVYVLTRT